MITTNGYRTNYTVTPANTDDRVAIWELTHLLTNIKLIGDKGYGSNELGKQLVKEKGIELLSLKHKNSKFQFPKHIRNILLKMRRIVETSFSQLAQEVTLYNYCIEG